MAGKNRVTLAFLDDPHVNEGAILWTPEMAEYALEHHNKRDKQRNIVKSALDKYTHEMIDGAWIPNWYQSWIAFEAGTRFVQNGQHTLSAIVASGKSIVIRTAWNVPAEHMQFWDGFKARTLALLVSQAGMDYVKQRNAFTRMVLWKDEGRDPTVLPTPMDVKRITADNAMANAIIVHISNHKNNREVGHFTACQYATWKIAQANGVDLALRFYDSMIEGINLTESDPRLHLARFLRARRVIGNTWWTRYQTVIGYVKAFNAWATSKPMGLLRVSGGEEMSDVVKTYGRIF